MATNAVVPVLLERKERSLASYWTSLPKTATGLLIKQVQWLLSYPNRHLGQPFLQGNFAPQQHELFQQNLPLIAAAGEVHTGSSTTHQKALIQEIKAAKAVKAANGWAAAPDVGGDDSAANDTKLQRDHTTNGHANGLTNSHANGHTNGHVNGHTNGHISSHTNSHTNGHVNGHTNGHTNGHSNITKPKLFGQGQLPEGLSGVFMRIGPNPLLQPLGGYHWFDGDGMVHAVRIKDAAASYCNRWVPTSRLEQESAEGWPLFIKLGDYPGLRGLGNIFLQRAKTALGLIDITAGGGTANTALVCHASRLLALNEGDLPYALRIMCDGLIEAVGRVTVSGPVGRSFTAHPKLDPVTGELHFFRYTFEKAPYVSYGVLGPKGDLIKSFDITAANIPRPTMMHDFAITENWAVFLDNPLCFDGERMVKHGQLPFSFKSEQGSRVGLLPRSATDDSSMIWCKLPAHMVFHVANAWEEADGTVKVFVCYHDTISLNLDTRTTGDIPPGEQPRLAVITVNPNSAEHIGDLSIMTSTVGDFPQINPRFVGRKQRYVYVATMVTGFGAAVKWDGVAKLDLWARQGEDALVGKAQLPEGCYNGETVFVPRFEDPQLCNGEDDGYLITYVHDENSSSSSGGSDAGSSVVIWDAQTMDKQPLAVVKMPQRVPYGFHALWVPEGQFQQQLKGHPLQPTSAV